MYKKPILIISGSVFLVTILLSVLFILNNENEALDSNNEQTISSTFQTNSQPNDPSITQPNLNIYGEEQSFFNEDGSPAEDHTPFLNAEISTNSVDQGVLRSEYTCVTNPNLQLRLNNIDLNEYISLIAKGDDKIIFTSLNISPNNENVPSELIDWLDNFCIDNGNKYEIQLFQHRNKVADVQKLTDSLPASSFRFSI